MIRTKMFLGLAVAIGALVMASGTADAQQGGGKAGNKQGLGQLVSGLVNVNVGAVNVQAVDLVDVSNVLNDNRVDVLRNAIQNNPVASNNSDFLNNALRDANLITDNQVVVGVLSGPAGALQLVTANLP